MEVLKIDFFVMNIIDGFIDISFRTLKIQITWNIGSCVCLSHTDFLMKTSWYWAITGVSCNTNPLVLHYFLIWYIYSYIDKENNYFRKDNWLLEAKQESGPTRIVTNSVWQYQSKTGLKTMFYLSVLIWIIS